MQLFRQNILLLLTLSISISVLSISCAGKKTISSEGLHFIHLGDAMPPSGGMKFKKYSYRDSVLKDNEYEWRAAMVKYDKGVVYLEADFFDEGILNRIRIETPELKLKNGITVGNTLVELRKVTSSWYVHPMPKYKLFDFYTEFLPRIHFVVEEKGRDMSDENWENYPMDSFQAESKIVAIVIY